ncbi:hypothetical protein AWB75_03876 [Caballeronia catudaia]|uniref:Uncharacterized protein n=1 Tax=Caballeronia catudaia TaxID=1777136 RepID=A0A158BQR8_9BURK|nr:hypothetical protein AWB75_03876 [Caballeronia catudaia]
MSPRSKSQPLFWSSGVKTKGALVFVIESLSFPWSHTLDAAHETAEFLQGWPAARTSRSNQALEAALPTLRNERADRSAGL